jgi:hypothetical protein
VFRYLKESERFALQGHPDHHVAFAGKTFGRQLTGNAFSPVMLAAVFGPIAECLGASGVLGGPPGKGDAAASAAESA